MLVCWSSSTRAFEKPECTKYQVLFDPSPRLHKYCLALFANTEHNRHVDQQGWLLDTFQNLRGDIDEKGNASHAERLRRGRFSRLWAHKDWLDPDLAGSEHTDEESSSQSDTEDMQASKPEPCDKPDNELPDGSSTRPGDGGDGDGGAA